MKRLLVCLLVLIGATSCSKSEIGADTLIEIEDEPVEEIFLYASYTNQGNGSGTSPDNAIDFLSASLWEKVSFSLKNSAVKVYFLEGNYKRAFTEKALVLKDIGNANNRLTLEGVANKTIFYANSSDHPTQRSVLFDIRNSVNIHVKNFTFTGDGSLGYALRITADEGKQTKDILISDCNWLDMRGVIYGATGVHQKGSSHVTYENCVFKRVGVDSHAHHIYNAYGPSHIHVIDSHFEDCTGDYIRFRDNSDYGIVTGSTFVKNEGFLGRVFISVPLFNSRPPVGDEYFPSNYSFTNNTFTNNSSPNTERAITFYHMGYSPPEWNYLLTDEEGEDFKSGSVEEKSAILSENFGIDADKIRIQGNSYSSRIKTQIALGTFSGYGAPSKGFDGWVNLEHVFNDSETPFPWEE